MASYLNGNLAHVCTHAHGSSDMEKIDTQYGLHVTDSVNRLQPVERRQCERYCHRAMKHSANIKFDFKLGKIATETRGMLVQVYRREAVTRKCVYEWSNAFAKGRKRLRMSHVRVGHRQAESKNG